MLFEAARLALTEHNVEGPYVTAGHHQYKAVWIRDTCFSARGLVLAGQEEVVRKTVRLYLDHLRPDGIGPKVFDSAWGFEWRQVEPCIRRALGLSRKQRGFDHTKLRAHYSDTISGREAFDSNALVLIAAHELDPPPLTEDEVVLMLSYYVRHTKNGLVHQPKHSDWQDSLQREGATCLMNMLLWRALWCCEQTFPSAVLQTFGPHFLLSYKRRIMQTFYRDGLFHSKEKGPYVSLDANLFALRWGLAPPGLYARLKADPVWVATTSPRDPQCAWPIRLAKMREYHCSTTWSWLRCFQAATALAQGDESESKVIHGLLEQAVERDGYLAECFGPDGEKWTTYAYHCDGPFSWGAAFALELRSALKEESRRSLGWG